MKFTKNRGSKRLRGRKADGRFARPTLEDAGMSACRSCGQFFKSTQWTEGDFPMPVKVTHCPHCGASV